MKILVIRHGESEADIKKVCEGRADFPLTYKGEEQAKALAAWISRNYRISRIYSSPLRRAYETASEISQAAGVMVTQLDELMEFNNGLLAGVPFSQVAERYPVVPDVPAHESVYGQETKLEFRLRAENVMSRVFYENRESDTVCLVTHGGMINQLFRAFFKLPLDFNVWITSGDTGVHEWVAIGTGRGITLTNSQEHLKPDRSSGQR